MSTLPVRRHDIVAAHGHRRTLTVFCPDQRHSVEVWSAGPALAEPVLAALLVYEGDRVIGAIERDRAMIADDRASAIRLGQSSPFVAKSAPLVEAVERLVTMHLRYLPAVDARGRVVGLLSDLDARRGVAAHRRLRS